MSSKVAKNDQVLIFYSGHGYYDSAFTKTGYLVPTDASFETPDKWIMNEELITYITKLPAAHTLLIYDACFSGSIILQGEKGLKKDTTFDPLAEEKEYLISTKETSSQVLTSGSVEKVPSKSIFAEYLIQILRDNQKRYFSAFSLAYRVINPVKLQTGKNPQFGTFSNNKGGDFYFIKKNE
jgi:hypothetical protein